MTQSVCSTLTLSQLSRLVRGEQQETDLRASAVVRLNVQLSVCLWFEVDVWFDLNQERIASHLLVKLLRYSVHRLSISFLFVGPFYTKHYHNKSLTTHRSQLAHPSTDKE